MPTPSVDTVRFYLALGCTLATYIHLPIYERESRDLQLEYTLTESDDDVADEVSHTP